MKTKTKDTPLSDIEWTTLWMACRYAYTRQTIASTTLPREIIMEYYYRMTEQQRRQLAEDITRELDTWGSQIENSWKKFAVAMNSDNHYSVTAIDGSHHTCFRFNDRVFPLKSYLANPSVDTFIPEENIRNPK